jgi:hypothetical protein
MKTFKYLNMKKLLFLIIFGTLFNLSTKSQSCTSTVYFDNMETYTWLGDWWAYSFSNFYTNFSVSPSVSAVHYGSGSGTSAIEQDWYALPTINSLNPNYTYKVKFRLASYTVTASTATTRGLDATDFLQVQLSRNGGPYVAEMTIYGFSNQTWTYSATGIASKTADGANTIYQRTVGGARADGYSTIELTLPSGTTSVAVDLYTRCNSAGEEFWIDNVQLIETIVNPAPVIFGDWVVCSGDSVTLTAVGGNTFSWSNGITNGVAFLPIITNTYTVTATYNGMINGTGGFNTCTNTESKEVFVDQNCILPIYLASFTGERNGNYNKLYWVTEQEINSSHFEIERSSNGIDFLRIGTEPANITNPYEFTDEAPLIGDNYYRLKMIDRDSQYAYSKIIQLEVEKPSTQYSVYPNPADNSLTYQYYTELPEFVKVEIFSYDGKLIKSYEAVCDACVNVLVLDTKDIMPGNYVIKFTHLDGIINTCKITKL